MYTNLNKLQHCVYEQMKRGLSTALFKAIIAVQCVPLFFYTTQNKYITLYKGEHHTWKALSALVVADAADAAAAVAAACCVSELTQRLIGAQQQASVQLLTAV
jgi:hypothetical protein